MGNNPVGRPESAEEFSELDRVRMYGQLFEKMDRMFTGVYLKESPTTWDQARCREILSFLAAMMGDDLQAISDLSGATYTEWEMGFLLLIRPLYGSLKGSDRENTAALLVRIRRARCQCKALKQMLTAVSVLAHQAASFQTNSRPEGL